MTNEAHRLLRSLRATRTFTAAPIPDYLVDGWLEDARWCGSSRNSQPWRFIVVRDRRILGELSELGDYAAHLADAAVAVAVAAVPGPFAFSTVFDLGRVSQSLMVAAHGDGVGSCVAVFEPEANIARARVLLDVPQDWRLDLAVAFGWPDDARLVSSAASPSPSGRLPIDVLVHRDGARRGTLQ